MKNFVLIFSASILLYCCVQKTASADFDQRVLDLLIETRNGRWLELPDLYDKTVIGIAEENAENLILVEKLKQRGYRTSETKRDINGLSGERLITVSMTDGKCPCEVVKIYRPTSFVSQYAVSEKIKCQ